MDEAPAVAVRYDQMASSFGHLPGGASLRSHGLENGRPQEPPPHLSAECRVELLFSKISRHALFITRGPSRFSLALEKTFSKHAFLKSMHDRPHGNADFAASEWLLLSLQRHHGRG